MRELASHTTIQTMTPRINNYVGRWDGTTIVSEERTYVTASSIDPCYRVCAGADRCSRRGWLGGDHRHENARQCGRRPADHADLRGSPTRTNAAERTAGPGRGAIWRPRGPDLIGGSPR